MKRLFLLSLFLLATSLAFPYEIYSDFDGGNIKVLKKRNNTVIIENELRDTKCWWFYWNFGVRNAQGKTITFEFANGDPIGSRGAAASFDLGKTWRWLGVENVKRAKGKASFSFEFPKGAKDVRFAFCIPYMPKNFDEFLSGLPQNSFKKFQICKTRKGRENFSYSFGNQNAKIKIFLTSRHHACEATGTFVMQGIIDEFINDKNFSENAEIIAVPFVDLDGVVNGDQGKARKPFDQNRDYLNEPTRYPTVGAIKKLYTQKADESDVIVGLDLHAPWIFRGGANNTNNTTYFVEIPQKEKSQALREFCKILEHKTAELGTNSINYKLAWNVKYGTMWNKNPKNTKFSAWVAQHEKTKFAASCEIPYSENVGTTITKENLLEFGANIAKSLKENLKTN